MALRVAVTPLEIPLVHPFKIARGEETVTGSVLVRLRYGDLEGLGEATPIERYGESPASVQAYFAANPLSAGDPYLLETLLHAGIPAAARAGLDLALHDLIGKDLGKPLYALLGLDPTRRRLPRSRSASPPPRDAGASLREVGAHPVIKVKLGAGTPSDESRRSRRFARSTPARFASMPTKAGRPSRPWRFCANSSVSRSNSANSRSRPACPNGCGWIRERIAIPIVTDEDARSRRGSAALAGCVDGINVKLAKCGGIRGALAMIHTARALGMKIMLGCMVESAIAATAAAHLSPLVDWADLDGPFLAARDPFEGVTYDGGKIVLPEAPGLGVREKAPSRDAALRRLRAGSLRNRRKDGARRDRVCAATTTVAVVDPPHAGKRVRDVLPYLRFRRADRRDRRRQPAVRARPRC